MDAAARAPRRADAARPGALLALLAALLLALSSAASATPAAPGVDVELQRDVFRIANQLRCPVCVSESVGVSNADVSIEMRNQIQQQLEAGRSEREILASFQARYGDWILLEPPRRGIHLLVWLLPAIVAAAGALALTLLVRRWLRKGAAPVEGVSAADLARVRAELAGQAPGRAPTDAREG